MDGAIKWIAEQVDDTDDFAELAALAMMGLEMVNDRRTEQAASRNASRADGVGQ